MSAVLTMKKFIALYFYLARTEDRELVVHAHSPRSFLSRWKVYDKKNVQETVSFVPTIATDTKRCYARSFSSLFVHAPIVLVACALIAQPVGVWRFLRCACVPAFIENLNA